ncbi:hypothetical protein PF008_g33009 [Phytophthora fragariae]|uniref:Secreted protein n=1 Tax=Phytophthora fragariae TaxID=53985 RepID=A0A6G0PY89_9STRA|nr:hypothetical protein PF003_g12014 [Phytophthora fragariae]KAE9260827.1 hypothetical protein PF008_g33009 [Phytophthora fragariae]
MRSAYSTWWATVAGASTFTALQTNCGAHTGAINARAVDTRTPTPKLATTGMPTTAYQGLGHLFKHALDLTGPR